MILDPGRQRYLIEQTRTGMSLVKQKEPMFEIKTNVALVTMVAVVTIVTVDRNINGCKTLEHFVST